MLAVTAYSAEHVAAFRTRIEALLTAWRALNPPAGSDFERECFTNMVLALDNGFVHRLRGAEGKDGNPLNEVRMISASLVNNGGKLTADKTIKYDPAKSVLGYQIGDDIALTADDFERLSTAFIDTIVTKYG